MVQNPDFYGEIKDFKKPENCLFVMVTNPMALALLKTPAEYDADIAVGDIQTLGIPMSFGGPYAGFIATKDKYMRQLAGRLCGKTLDKDGNVAYTLTIIFVQTKHLLHFVQQFILQLLVKMGFII